MYPMHGVQHGSVQTDRLQEPADGAVICLAIVLIEHRNQRIASRETCPVQIRREKKLEQGSFPIRSGLLELLLFHSAQNVFVPVFGIVKEKSHGFMALLSASILMKRNICPDRANISSPVYCDAAALDGRGQAGLSSRLSSLSWMRGSRPAKCDAKALW
jgi:hypothetical protein